MRKITNTCKLHNFGAFAVHRRLNWLSEPSQHTHCDRSTGKEQISYSWHLTLIEILFSVALLAAKFNSLFDYCFHWILWWVANSIPWLIFLVDIEIFSIFVREKKPSTFSIDNFTWIVIIQIDYAKICLFWKKRTWCKNTCYVKIFGEYLKKNWSHKISDWKFSPTYICGGRIDLVK